MINSESLIEESIRVLQALYPEGFAMVAASNSRAGRRMRQIHIAALNGNVRVAVHRGGYPHLAEGGRIP